MPETVIVISTHCTLLVKVILPNMSHSHSAKNDALVRKFKFTACARAIAHAPHPSSSLTALLDKVAHIVMRNPAAHSFYLEKVPVQGMSKKRALGCVNATGKARQRW